MAGKSSFKSDLLLFIGKLTLFLQINEGWYVPVAVRHENSTTCDEERHH